MPGPNQPIENSKEWWEFKYQAKESAYGKEPSKFLVENLSSIRKGKVLDLAMGEGRNAVYLASKGYTVEGIDFAPTALARAEKLAAETGVKLTIQNKDIDMLLLPLMTYECVLICDYKPSLRFFKDVNRGLTQGGTIFIDGFTVDQIRHTNAGGAGPKLEMFECFKANEVLQNLKNVHVVFYQEREVEKDRFRVQCIARKTGLVG